MRVISNHPKRYALANELHTRPFPKVMVPSTIACLAIKQEDAAAGRNRDADRDHLCALLDRHGAVHPPPGAKHYSGEIGRSSIKWEQHSEFVAYTAIQPGLQDRPFDPAGFSVGPEDWLSQAPGGVMTSILIRVMEMPPEEEIPQLLSDWFVAESLAVSRVIEDAAVIAGDFRIDSAGHMRFVVFVRPETGPGRVGRIVQRICEIETYKAMSMLGFERARALSPQIGALDARLTELMRDMTGRDAASEATLGQLLEVSEELEALAARSSYRFGATGAYRAIVEQRTHVLRERPFGGRQNIAEFLMRRYEPAMRTVDSTEARLQTLADRAMRAAQLLRTRVEVERSAQSQTLLASMDRRADMQLRLQHTVEGLSVVAISYYAVSLVGYLLYPLAAQLGVSREMLIAAAVLPVVAGVWLGVRLIRKRLE